LIGSAFARIFFGAPLAFCSPKEEVWRLRAAGASQVDSLLPARAARASMVRCSKYFGSSWAAARGGRPTRVADAAERAPQMAPEGGGKVLLTPEGSDRVPNDLRILHDMIALFQENKIRKREVSISTYTS
jgi:hypothetical protein